MSVSILVYEHLTAGGVADAVPVALADAGLAMWRALVDDFASAGCKVWTTVGEREEITTGKDATTRIRSAGEVDALVHDLALKCDGAIIVAPETDGILASWIERFTAWKVPVLNCSAKTIALCADKYALWKHLDKHGVAAVPTKAASAEALLQGMREALAAAGGAYIIKPRDGAGCESTFLCRSPGDVERLRERVTGEKWIAQPWVSGTPVSMSFIAGGKGLRPLLAGAQNIQGDSELSYAGGTLPLSKKLADRAIWLATQAVKTLKDLRGFIGVDLILGDGPKDDVVVEINPRVTVSYCGLRLLCGTNLPKAMIDDDAPIKWRRGSVSFDHAGRITQGGA